MGRLPFVDWVRGFAVVAMVVWHTADAWLLPTLRQGQAWTALRFIGGLAAPSFLFLAGCAAALGARDPDSPRNADRTLRAAAGRGLEVALLGYLLRYQTWMIDASAIIHLEKARAWLPLGLGYASLVWSSQRLADAPRKALTRALLGVALVAAGLAQVEAVAAGRFARLLQVDVLQAIGFSLVLLALGERYLGLLRRPRALCTLGIAIACFTEPIASLLPGPLPPALAGYLGRFDPAKGQPFAALFPLFPWFAYACFGAALGALLKRVRSAPDRTIIQFALLGACMALLTSEAHAHVRDAIASVPWSVQPIRVAFRVGIVLTLLMVGWVWASPVRGRLLLAFGRASLRLYWAHLLVAYGVLGRALQKQLGFGAWALWLVPLFVALWLLTQVGTRVAKPRPATAQI